MMKYFTAQKKQIYLEVKPLARGGEGEVFKVLYGSGASKQCAKIYFPHQRTKERERKLIHLCRKSYAPELDKPYLLCFPREIIYDEHGEFLGFLMSEAFPDSIQLYQLVTPKISNKLPAKWHLKYDRSTKDGILNRLKLCVNIAIGIHSIHKTGNLVLVDFKPQNILVTDSGQISIIDLDSLQFHESTRLCFHAKVATPEYTPKEGERLNPADDEISETWDLFSLAVVFYELLFGIHPYVGTAKGQYSEVSTISEKINKNLFVHGSKRSYLSKIPALHNNFEKLPDTLKLLFIAAFEQGSSSPSLRPSAEKWGTQIVTEIAQNRSALSSVVQPPLNRTIPPKVKYDEGAKTTGVGRLKYGGTIVQKVPKSNTIGRDKQDAIFFWIAFSLIVLILLYGYLNNLTPSERGNSLNESSTVDYPVIVEAPVDTLAVDTSAADAAFYRDKELSIENQIEETENYINVVNEYGEGNGKVYFWTRQQTQGYIRLYIDDQDKGVLTTYFANQYLPTCDEDGVFGIVLPSGDYKFFGESATLSWKGQISVHEGKCGGIELE